MKMREIAWCHGKSPNVKIPNGKCPMLNGANNEENNVALFKIVASVSYPLTILPYHMK